MNDHQIPEPFISVIGLGGRRGYFPVKNLNRAGSLAVFFILSAGSVLVFLYGLYLSHAIYLQHGPALIGDTLTVPLLIAFALLLVGLAAGRSAFVNWNKGVGVYEQGIAVRDRKGIQAWRWDEIVSLTAAVARPHAFGIVTGTRHVYSLFNRLNQSLVLDDIYVKVEELAEAIQAGIFPILYERAAQQYNAGQRLVFGPVAIGRDGIEIGKKTIPWTGVQQVSVKQGILRVFRTGGGWFNRASVPVSVIPNLKVLLSIIHQVIGLQVD